MVHVRARVAAARAGARLSIPLLFLFLALAPSSVLAFHPPDPTPGKHTGEYLHNPHMQSSQVPVPGGSTNGTPPGGVHNSFGSLKNGSPADPPASSSQGQQSDVQIQTAGASLPALTSGSNLGQDAWLVVIILAALIAANVVLGVLYASRGGNYLVRRMLRPAPVTA